jgi:hypothetical protein
MQFDTPILSKPYVKYVGVVPLMADREFWSPVIMCRQTQLPPDIIYTLVTATGDRFVDNLSNPLIAVT